MDNSINNLPCKEELESLKKKLVSAPETEKVLSALKSDGKKLEQLRQTLLDGDTKGAAGLLSTMLSSPEAQAAFLSLSDVLE